MARFQVKKDGTGFVIIPKSTWQRKGWKQGTELDLVEGMDGSLIIREVRR